MKISAVIISRNDNYGGYLNERATYAINSAINTYDEVIGYLGTLDLINDLENYYKYLPKDTQKFWDVYTKSFK